MKYLPFIILDIKMSRKIIVIFEMLIWPLLTLSSLGLFTIFVKADYPMKLFLLTGAVGWSCIYFSQVSVSRAFLSEIWHKTLKQTFSLPITFREFLVGHWLYGVIGSTIGFTCMSLVAMSFFNFNLFGIGAYIPLVIGLATICGFIIGTIVVLLIALLGYRIDFLAWCIVDMIVFISGVYYSINVFPYPIPIISHFFPVVYVLEGMREILSTGAGLTILLRGYAVALVWVAIILVLIGKIENYTRKTGFYQRYG